jgi:ankyrin repeat protein
MAAMLLRAQTNNLTALLQQGLFEEQADRNLDAAISNYQSLATEFDQDRQVGATAIFRLGECYRMQGKTNEAAQEYERIIKDFSDQATLVTLSRQDLAGMGVSVSTTTSTAGPDTELWDKVKNLSPAELEKVLPILVPDAILTGLLQQRNEAETKLAQLNVEYTPANPEVISHKAALDAINRQIFEKVDAIMQALKMRAQSSETITVSAAPVDDEDREIQRIQQMIQNSPDLVNARDDKGHTPLENAAINGQLKVATFLLDHGADINAGYGSALDQAVNAGNRAMVEFLLNRGANINANENNGQGSTPLHTAAAKGFQAVTEVLLANKAGVNAQNNNGETPLISAVQHGQLKIAQMLLAAGANPNLKDNAGQTVLNYAIGQSPEIFHMLLDAGTNPNTEDSLGRTPLSYAASRDTPDVVKLLLEAKADPNGGTLDAPLLSAIQRKSAASAELLLQAGADPNAIGRVDWQTQIGNTIFYGQFGNQRASITPLWLAIDSKQVPIVQLLLKYKADPNSTQVENQSPLFGALDNTDILAAMLDAGGKPDSLTPTGWPLLDQAVTQTNFVAVQLLLKHGANANVSLNPPDNPVGYTPLHFAAQQLVDPKIIELLLDDHADPNIRGGDGKTPLDLLKDAIAQISSGTFHWSPAPASPSEQMAVAMELADLLRQHGALDNLPHWNSIKVSRPNANSSTPVFQNETNDWNRFTLMETVLDYYEYASSATSWNMYDKWTQYPINPDMPFPDLSRVTILRPSHESTNFTRIHVNLLNDTNGIDCSKDLPVEFGDTVEIPEREHTLAESDTNGPLWIIQISGCLQGRSGTVKLVVDGSQTIQIPLDQFGPLDCDVKQVLGSSQAQNVLTSDSDLSHVKVVRRDPQTGKSREWTPNGAAQQPENQPSQLNFQDRLRSIINHSSNTPPDPSSLWLRDGDVIEVPVKQ